jgi:glycosyltransferase involved in cell wall biosynthesis
MIPDPNPSNFDRAWTFRDLEQAQIDLYVSSFQRRLCTVVDDFAPDVIECQHIWLMPYAVAELGLPFVVAAHHSDQMGFHYDERIRPYATRAAQAASFIFALTTPNHDEIVELYDVAPDKVITLGNGYDREVFKPVDVDRAALFDRFDLDIPEDAPLVTFAGKLSKTKGVDVLLHAHQIVHERQAVAAEAPYHLILFGTGSLDDVLDDDRPHSLDRVHLLGHQPYAVVRDFHNVAAFSVMPSRTEGFGLAALEAMGCGLPVLTTDIGAADTFAVGPVVPPEDADALAGAMLDLLRLAPSDRTDLGEAALARAHTFSWDAIAERRLDTYARMSPTDATS